MRVVVVGAGLAGVETVKGLRERGFSGELLLLGDEREPPYDRPPLSKHVLRSEREPFRLLSDQDDVQLQLGVAALGLDASHRRVHTSGGDVEYDALVVATGAAARRLPAVGGVVLRTLGDALTLRAGLVEGARLVIVGAGLVGCEVAASARTLGCEVALVDVESVPMGRVLGAQVGERLARLHRERGVVLHLGTTAVRSGPHEVLLQEGTRLPVDVVVEAVGAVPATGWLADSGVALGDGVLCDARGRTGLEKVWAVGDVARWAGVRREHWTSAVEQAAVVAADILGEGADLDTVPYWWSEQYDLRLQGLGSVTADDEVTVVRTGKRQREVAVYARAGRVTGVVGFSASAAVLALRPAVKERAAVADVLAALS